MILGTHLDRLNKCIEQNSDADRSSQQFDESCGTEESQESNLNNSRRVDNTSSNCYKVERVPRVFKIRLKRRNENKKKLIGKV